jgi:hypothetical protein
MELKIHPASPCPGRSNKNITQFLTVWYSRLKINSILQNKEACSKLKFADNVGGMSAKSLAMCTL